MTDMTTTAHGATAGVELDKLEALLNAATPGDWTHKRHGVIVAGPYRQYTNGAAQSQIAAFNVTFHEQAPDDEPERQIANAEFAVAAKNSMASLIALARRAQPRAEQADDLPSPTLVPLPAPYLNLSDEEGSEPYPVWLSAHMMAYARKYAIYALARQAAPEAPTLNADERVRLLAWFAEHKQHHFVTDEDEALIAKLVGVPAPATQQAGAAAECQACDGHGCARYPDGEWEGKCATCGGTGNDSPAATTASASREPFMWFDPAQVERTKLTDYADHIGIIGSSVKFGNFTEPLYRAPAPSQEAAPEDVIAIAARIFDFKPHKQTEETKAKYLQFAAVIAQQGAAQATKERRTGFGEGVRAAATIAEKDGNPVLAERIRDLQSRAAQEAHAGADTERDAIDAARYRFIREADLDNIAAGNWKTGRVVDGVKFDEAIDAAIAANTSLEKKNG